MEKALPPTEDISRYLFKGDFDSELNVKGRAFTPKKGQRSVSVYRIGRIVIEGKESSITEEQIWQIAEEKIGLREHTGAVVARTDFKVRHVLDADIGLNVVEHKEDHPRHAHIEPFPVLVPDASADEQRKFEMKRLTMRNKLAQNLKAVLKVQQPFF